MAKKIKVYFKEENQEILIISDPDGLELGKFTMKELKRLKRFIQRSRPIVYERVLEILKRDPGLKHYLYSRQDVKNMKL